MSATGDPGASAVEVVVAGSVRMSANPPDQISLYPSKDHLEVGALVQSALAIGALVAMGWLLAHAIFGDQGKPGLHVFDTLLAFVVGFVGLAVCGSGAVRYLRMRLHPRPLLRIDETGLECARGRVSWADVEHVSLKDVGGGRRALLFTLSPQAVSPSQAEGYEEDGVSIEPPELRIVLPGVGEKRAREIVQAFYPGEIS